MEPERRVLSLFLSFLEINDLEKNTGGWREVLLCISIGVIEGTVGIRQHPSGHWDTVPRVAPSQRAGCKTKEGFGKR